MLFFVILACTHRSRRAHIGIETERLAHEICTQSNQVRAKHHRTQLTIDPILNRAAQRYADTLKNSPFFSHTNPVSIFGRNPMARIIQAGGKKATTAENLAKLPILQIPIRKHQLVVMNHERILYRHPDKTSPIPQHTTITAAKATIQSWLNSSGHRKNLLYPDMTHIGCGASIQISKKNIPMMIAVQVFQSQ